MGQNQSFFTEDVWHIPQLLLSVKNEMLETSAQRSISKSKAACSLLTHVNLLPFICCHVPFLFMIEITLFNKKVF